VDRRSPGQGLPPTLQRLLDGFAVEPTDAKAFRTLEQSLFEAGAWSQLAGVYELRLSVLAPEGLERTQVLLRLASLLEDRLGDRPAARRRYEEALRSEPMHARALAGLRRLHTREGSLTAALQIGEMEESLELAPAERARMLGEVGDLWRVVGEAGEAQRRFEDALRLDGTCEPALAGAAALAEARGDHAAALRLHERRLFQLRGPARAEALERVAALLPEGNERRMRDLLREALREGSDRRGPLERLIALERRLRAWNGVEELSRRLFELVEEPQERLAIALDSATVALDEADDPARALAWLELAAGIDSADLRVWKLRARSVRRAGDTNALLPVLERIAELEGASPVLALELAVLCERANDLPRAVHWLEQALRCDPRDAEALTVLDRCLARLGRDAERADVLARRIEVSDAPAERGALALELGDLCAGALEDPDAAELAYRRSLAEQPGAGAEERLQELLRKLGRIPELARLLEERATSAGDPALAAGAWRALARLRQEEQSDPTGARDALRRALEAGPDSPDGRRALAELHALAASASRPDWAIEACELELGRAPSDERRAALLACIVETARKAGDPLRARAAAQQWSLLSTEPAPWQALADLAREIGDVATEAGALERLEALLDADPAARASALARRAELALEQADASALETAIHWYKRSLAAHDVVERRLRLADLCRRSADLPGVVAELEAVLRVAPERADARIELARALDEIGDASRAAELLAPLAARDPLDATAAELLDGILVRADRCDERIDLLRRRLACARDRDEQRRLAAQLGELLLAQGRAADGAALLRDLADPRNPGRVEDLYERSLGAQGADGELADWLNARAPNVPEGARIELWLRCAGLLERLGRDAEAIACLERAEALAPRARRAELRAALFTLLERTGDASARVAALGRALDDSGDAVERATLRLARAELLAGALGRCDAALQELEQALAEAPAHLEALRALAALCAGRDPARRAALLERLAASSPQRDERVAALLERADLLARGPANLRDPVAAERALLRLVELEPKHRGAFERLCEIYEASGRFADLERLLRDAVVDDAASRADRRALALRLAERRRSAGDREGAIAWLHEARLAGAGSPALDRLLLRCLEEAGDQAGVVELCAERARVETGPARRDWLERWLVALEAVGADAEARRRALDALRHELPNDPWLLEKELELLRQDGLERERADGLERAIESAAPGDRRRRVRARELIALCDDALGAPERALACALRELRWDPGLRPVAARLAARVGDVEREVELLRPLCQASEPRTEPTAVRRLALGLARLGRRDEAVPWLVRALESQPRDPALCAALVEALRAGDDASALSRALEAWLPHVPGEQRVNVVREGFEAAERARERNAAARWLRRWQRLEPLPEPLVRHWASLERDLGEPAERLTSLTTLLAVSTDANERALLHAELAELHTRRGDLELADQAWQGALGAAPVTPAAWLASREEVLARLGATGDRLATLRALARHPDRSSGDRSRAQQRWLQLLATQPDRRDEAIRELRAAFDLDPAAERTQQLARGRKLLELLEAAGRLDEWCAVCERVAPLVGGEERARLERKLAECLSSLGARDPARRAWRAVLERNRDDAQALAALEELARVPGDEGERAGLLERRARIAAPRERAALWLEAARVQWRALGDANAALRDVDAALEDDGKSSEALALCIELCRHLGHAEREKAALRARLTSNPEPPDRAEGWLRLAQLAIERPDGAEEALQAAERALDASAATRAEARALFERAGRFERAAEILELELESCPPSRRAELLSHAARIAWDELEDAERCCRALERLEREDTPAPEDLERWSLALAALGRLDESLARRRAALERLGDRARPERWIELAEAAAERLGDLSLARSACDAALRKDPGAIRALALRADLCAQLGDAAGEVADAERLGARLERGPEAAAAFARAARVAQEALGEVERAYELYRNALERQAGSIEALLGAGRIALARKEWSRAERWLGEACTLLDAGERGARLAGAARGAATAALELGRDAEALRFLELARRSAPDDGDTLERIAATSLRLRAFGSARGALEARLALGDVDPRRRVELMLELASALRGEGRVEDAIRTLEQVRALAPDDVRPLAGLVELCERAGDREATLARLEDWLARAPERERPELLLRAARIEAALERPGRARARLEPLLAADRLPARGWPDLIDWTLAAEGPDAALAIASRARAGAPDRGAQAAVAWVEARAHARAGRSGDAARKAGEALELDPSHLEAARLLASHLGQAESWQAAVSQLERAIELARPPAPLEAELWEAVGRAYAGPLEDLRRAQQAYRRALTCNPLRSSAREALADTTAFEPATHAESLLLHRDLLEQYPAREGSWRAIARIAGHYHRESIRQTAEAVVHALVERGERESDRRPPLALGGEARPLPELAAATEFLAALEEVDALPATPATAPFPRLPAAIQSELSGMVGRAWQLADEVLRALWSQAGRAAADSSFEALPWKARRRLKQAQRNADAETLRRVDPSAWRQDLLARAAASALAKRRIGLAEALIGLIASWPATAQLEPRASGQLHAIAPLCPPARALLLRIADECLGALGTA
jgi:tetratricopeptide (TPR) repeat protein